MKHRLLYSVHVMHAYCTLNDIVLCALSSNAYSPLESLISILCEIPLNIEAIESKELCLHHLREIVNYDDEYENDRHKNGN